MRVEFLGVNGAAPVRRDNGSSDMGASTDKATPLGQFAALPTKCAHCEGPLQSPIVCEDCRSLFPASGVDYFAVLGLPRRYAIDPERMRRSFRSIARNVHPDRHTDQPPDVRALATRLSADVNQAFQVLSDPVQRAGYLLELYGGPSAADLREVADNVLTDVMMIREEVEAARGAGDAGALARHRAAVTEKKDRALQQIAELAERVAVADGEEKRTLRRLLNSMRYYDNLLAELAVDPLGRPHRTSAVDVRAG